MSDGGVDWGLCSCRYEMFNLVMETFSSGYNEARKGSHGREDLALLQHYYSQCGTRFAGLAYQHSRIWTDLNAWIRLAFGRRGNFPLHDRHCRPEVYAASDCLKTKAVSNIKFGVLYTVGDISESLSGVQSSYLHWYSLLYKSGDSSDCFTRSWPCLLCLLPGGGGGGSPALTSGADPTCRLYRFMLPGTETMDQLNILPQWKILFELLESNGFHLLSRRARLLRAVADVLYTTVLAQRRG